MSEQDYNISSPPSFSLFPEEYNNETHNINEFFEQNSSEYEAFSLFDNDTDDTTYYNITGNDTTDHDSDDIIIMDDDTTDYDTTDSENSVNSKNLQENNHEEVERDEIIGHLEQMKFTPCVIIDFVKGKIQRCGELGKLRQLPNL